MPEGDILRRTAAALDRGLAGRRLVRSELRWPSAAGLTFEGRTVLGTHAYGKHLFTRFDDQRTLHTHLRMEGIWRVVPTGSPRAVGRGAFVRAVLGNDEWTAVGDRLGMLDVVPTGDEHTLIGHLGPDVLAADFPADGLAEAHGPQRHRSEPHRHRRDRARTDDAGAREVGPTLPTVRLGDPGGAGAPSTDATPGLLLPGLPAAGVKPISRPA